MFYSVFVLGKKGPLARVWLAAHWDKKITKAQILETNIVESVDSILQPKIKLSLRTSSHLLLGIVRIYARKALYLLQDCQDAAFKIKSAFRPGVVDLPDGKTEAAISAITLPEMFDFINDFDLIAEPQLQIDAPTTTANIRNITLVEDISSIHVDDPLGVNDVVDWSEIGSIGGGSINIKDAGESSLMNDSGVSLRNDRPYDLYDRPALDDGFGGQIGVGILEEEDVFKMTEPNPEESQEVAQNTLENGHQLMDDNEDRPNSRMSDLSYADSGPHSAGPPSIGSFDGDDVFSNLDNGPIDNQSLITESELNMPRNVNEQPPGTLSQNTMVLEPIDSQQGGMERRRKRRKKIGMVIDEVKTLSGEEMKSQLSDTSDIVANLDLAPPNKMLMNWKKTGLSDKLFTLPERSITAKVLFQYYSRNLITTRYEDENEMPNYDLAEEDLERFREEMVNGQHNHLPDLQDIEHDLPQQLSPMQPPKTPRLAPKSPAPQRSKSKKRPGEDKENRESNKRARNETTLSKFEKSNIVDRTTDSLHNDMSSHPPLHDISSIQEVQEARAGSMANGSVSYMPPHLDGSDNEEREEEEDDIFDDFGGGPMSVGPMEEMLPDETADQFEERMRTKRSNQLLKHMGTQLDEAGHINFTSLIRNNKRKVVAQKFYALLVLKKQLAIELYQNKDIPYSELTITKGHKYDEHMVANIT